MANYSTLKTGTASFDSMIKHFGVITVMNAAVYEPMKIPFSEVTAKQIYTMYSKFGSPLCALNTLKISNISVEGPDKTITGGQYSNPLIKFGKTARLEMQDALGNIEALAYLGGGVAEWNGEKGLGNTSAKDLAFHMGENFAGPKTIIGESFFIDKVTGNQVPVRIMFYNVLPDSIFNLNQDAEGDAAVFDLNGDLLAVNIKVGSNQHIGTFYSIISSDTEDVITEAVSGDEQGVVKFSTIGDIPANKHITIIPYDESIKTFLSPVISTDKTITNSTLYKNKSLKAIYSFDSVAIEGKINDDNTLELQTPYKDFKVKIAGVWDTDGNDLKDTIKQGESASWINTIAHDHGKITLTTITDAPDNKKVIIDYYCSGAASKIE